MVPVVALDLLYWLGGRLTAAPFTDGMISLLELAQQQGATAPDSAETIATLRTLGQGDRSVRAALARATAPAPGPARQRTSRTALGRGDARPGHWSLVVLLVVALVVLGLLWLAVSLSLLAPLARQEAFSLPAALRQVPRCWLRLLGLAAIVVAGLCLLLLPLLILVTIVGLLGLDAAPLLLLLLVPLLVLYVYLALAPEAIAVSDVGPFRAIKLSVGVVRRNFWAMFGLIAATYLLSVGFPYGWRLLTQQAAGVPLAILGNGFIATGLTAAAMFFYRERLGVLEGVKSANHEVRDMK
jgi:hypothetical protein